MVKTLLAFVLGMLFLHACGDGNEEHTGTQPRAFVDNGDGTSSTCVRCACGVEFFSGAVAGIPVCSDGYVRAVRGGR